MGYFFVVDEGGFITGATEKSNVNTVSDLNIKTFIKPKWTGTEWVEGETEEEQSQRESLQYLESLKPTPQELEDADLEIKVLSLLFEMGIVQHGR